MKRKFWLNSFFIFCVFVMIMASSLGFYNTYDEKRITEKRREVTVEIVDAPNSCENLGRRPPHITLKYENEIFKKKMDYKYCDLIIGKNYVSMLTDNEQEEFIFPNEYDPADFLYVSIIFVLAIIMTWRMFWYKKKSD